MLMLASSFNVREAAMAKSFFFTINLLIKSDSHLEKAISSVIADENFFLNNVQLILIDSLCSDLSLEICSRYSKKYPDNVYFIDASEKNEFECYNDSKPLCLGQYIAFIDNYGEYSKKTLNSLMKTLHSCKIPVLCIQPAVSPSGAEPSAYVSDVENGIVKLKETPEKFILMLGCYFFNRKISDKLLFDGGLKFHGDYKYITEALLLTYSYVFTNAHVYTTTYPTEREPFTYLPQYSKYFYSQCIDEFVIPMLINYPGSVLCQCIMLYIIEMRFSLNEGEKYKHVIIGNYIDSFLDKVSEALKYIDNAVILNKNVCRRCMLDDEMPFRLLRIKYKSAELKPEIDLALPKETLERSYSDANCRLVKTELCGEFMAHFKQAPVGSSRDITADLTAINYDSDGLYIDGILYGCSYLSDGEFSIFSNINGERSKVIPSQVYTLKRYFERPFLRRYSFRFFVPVSQGKTIDTFYLVMKYRNLAFRIGLTFNGTFSRLSTAIKYSYWIFGEKLMTYDPKTKSVIIRRATSSLTSLCESKFMAEASKKLSLSEELHYRQLRKNIRSTLTEKTDHKYLMFYDEYGINCNGSLLFRYFSRNKSNERLEVFYAAIRNSDEQEFLLEGEYENVLDVGSKRTKIIAVCSDIIFASDCDVYESLGFNSKDILLLKDLFNAKTVSVKNFFMTYNTAQFDNRLRDNTQLCFCASEKEKEHLLKSIYDYDEAMIKVSGYPVLDTLKDDRKKIILVSPGERRQFCIYNNSDYYHFSESRFFRLYNQLISDPKLLEAMRNNGYQLAVMMPRSIEKYLKLFQSNDVVKLYEYTEENETLLISESALLITDYGELLYKFAYLNKPVVYYFPHSLPIQQEYKNEGLSKSSLGEMFFEHDSIIEYLIKEMENGFPQKETYAKKCADFFKYHDQDNCRRIAKTIINTFFSDLYKS